MRISDWSSVVCSSVLGGLNLLPWSEGARSLRVRAVFAGREELSDQALMAQIDDWLPPLLAGKRRLSAVDPAALSAVLASLVGWDAKQQFDRLAPPEIGRASCRESVCSCV